jgi:hypothetical protein
MYSMAKILKNYSLNIKFPKYESGLNGKRAGSEIM